MKRTFKSYLREREYTEETIKHMEETIRRYRTWLKENNSSAYLADHRTAIQYIEHLKYYHKFQPLTINLKLAHLRHYYSFLVTIKNPFKGLKVRGEKKKVRAGWRKEDELLELYLELPENTPLERRVKVLAGFYIFQGVSTRDMLHLEVQHLNLKQGKVTIPETRRGNERTLHMNPVQKLHLLEVFGNEEHQGDALVYQVLTEASQDKWIFKHLHQQLTKHATYESFNQLRYSVIRNWLKRHNLRRVQYMAGHRYISTTEKLLEGDYEELRLAVIDKHPLG